MTLPPLREPTETRVVEPVTPRDRFVLGYTVFRKRHPWFVEDTTTATRRRFTTREKAIAALEQSGVSS